MSKEQIIKLMQPFDEKKMEAYTISKQITSANLNTPNLKNRFVYPELVMFDAFDV